MNAPQLKEKIDVSNKVFWLSCSDGSASVYCFIYGQVRPKVYEISKEVAEDFNIRYSLPFKRYPLNSWQE